MKEELSLRPISLSLLDTTNLDRSYEIIINYLENPSEALLLEEFTFSCLAQRDDSRPNGCWIGHQNKREAELITEAIDKLDLSSDDREKFRESLLWKGREIAAVKAGETIDYYAPRFDAWYAQAAAVLIINLAPNIQLVMVPGLSGGLEDLLLRNNHDQVAHPVLQKLHTVEFLPMGDYRLYYEAFDIIESLRLFHRLPEFRTFTIEDATFDNCMNILLPGTSNLKGIEIVNCEVPGKTAAACIQMATALEKVKIAAGGHRALEGGRITLCPRTLGEALYYHKETLKILDLDLDCQYDTSPEDYDLDEYEEDENGQQSLIPIKDRRSDDEWWKRDLDLGYLDRQITDDRNFGFTIGSFKDFSALISLSIGVKFLLGTKGQAPFRLIDALPPSLESLTIRGYTKDKDKEHDSQLAQLLENSQNFPNLVHIDGINEPIPSALTGDDISSDIEEETDSEGSADEIQDREDEDIENQEDINDEEDRGEGDNDEDTEAARSSKRQRRHT